jgi:hypothetical protein
MRATAPLQTNSVRAEQSNPSLGGRLLQRKLTVGASNDPLEKEADGVAERVLAMPQHFSIGSAGPRIQRLSEHPTGQWDTAPARVDKVLASPGRPLEPTLRQDMERRFGFDFSQVRVHSGAAAEQSARDLNATAYTVGHNIVFDVGRYAPETREGRRLIAHELAHVVQQSKWPERTTGDQRNGKRGLSPNSRSISEVGADAYSSGQSVVFSSGKSTPKIYQGRRLIAHEWAHAVQQTKIGASPEVIQRYEGGGGAPGSEKQGGFRGAPQSPGQWPIAPTPKPREQGIEAPDECSFPPFSIPECQGAMDPDIIQHEPRRWSILIYLCHKAIKGCWERAKFLASY